MDALYQKIGEKKLVLIRIVHYHQVFIAEAAEHSINKYLTAAQEVLK